MEAINKISTTAVPLPLENIDTDQIIPARFLKAVSRDGFGQNLFRDWRYDERGNLIEDFVLNNPGYSGKILVAGKNFGCGSSREHAAWAIYDYGFRVVISSFFADIFKSNALNNGLLPIRVEPSVLKDIFLGIENNPSLAIDIDLDNQIIKSDEINLKQDFEISPYKKQCLLKGYNDLDFLLSLKDEIATFENRLKFAS